MRHGELTLFCGPMFADKTNDLIKEILFRTYFEAPDTSSEASIYRIAFDTRGRSEDITSHDGFRVQARTVSGIEDIPVDKGSFAFFDEVQFFAPPYFDGDFIEHVRMLRENGIDVFCAGLDMDFMGRAFEITASLMAEASKIERKTSICTCCGAPATHTARRLEGLDRFVPGSGEAYAPMCRAHWFLQLRGEAPA